MTMHPSKLTVEVLFLFPYMNNKMVPSSYNCNYVNESIMANILGIGGMTQSGRYYTPVMDKIALPIPLEKGLPKQKEPKVVPNMIKELVTEKKVSEFLKFIKHSEYNVVEQLNNLPARISLLALLLNSESHRNALMKVLSEAYVAYNISMEKVDQLVSNIDMSNMIAFFDDEISSKGRGSTEALYITISYKGYTLPRALLDNGSSVNVIPMTILSRLAVDISHMRKT